MKKLKEQQEAARCDLLLAEEVRKWQRNSVSKRVPLKKLALRLRCSEAKLKSIIKSGSRKRARRATVRVKVCEGAQKSIVFHKFRACKGRSLRDLCSSTVARRAGVAKKDWRSVRRWTQEHRGEVKSRYQQYWRAWHSQDHSQAIDQ